MDLEQVYRGQLGRGRFSTLVNPEGSVVWVSEYLRYRVAECSSQDAFSRILTQINGGGVPPVCGQNEQPFPDRQDALTFRRQLESVYQSRGGTPAETYVDDEGDVIWTMEYLRYVLSGCSHSTTVQKIMDQINQRGVPADCGSAPAPAPPPPTPTPPTATLVARAGGPYGPVNAGAPGITLDGLASTSTPNPIAHYYWTCGQSGNTDCSKDSPRPTFVYTKQGSLNTVSTYTATLIIEDTAGRRSAPATATVRVTNVY